MDRSLAEIFLKESPPLSADRLQTMMCWYLDYHCDLDVVRLLWDHGVRPTLDTICQALITQYGDPEEIVALFVELGVDLNVVDDYGLPVIHHILIAATASECPKGCCEEMSCEDRRYVADILIPALLAAGVRIEGDVRVGMWAELRGRVDDERQDESD